MRECVAVLLNLEDRSAEQIFGFPDVVKLKSCATSSRTSPNQTPSSISSWKSITAASSMKKRCGCWNHEFRP
jgi:uncharacterized protein (DUF1810 family)